MRKVNNAPHELWEPELMPKITNNKMNNDKTQKYKANPHIWGSGTSECGIFVCQMTQTINPYPILVKINESTNCFSIKAVYHTPS